MFLSHFNKNVLSEYKKEHKPIGVKIEVEKKKVVITDFKSCYKTLIKNTVYSWFY